MVGAVAACLLLLFAQACEEPRFSACKKDDDCGGKTKHCVDHKCVECGSDDDCKVGYCSFGVCTTLGGPAPHVTPEPSGKSSAGPPAETPEPTP